MDVIRSVALVFLGGAMAACGLVGPDDRWEDRRRVLEENRMIWEQSGIDTYRFELTRACFCALAGDFVVTVDDGVVVSAHPVMGDTLPAAERQYLETVDDLFDRLERAIEEEVHEYRVEYHLQLGHPTVAYLDPIRNAIDDEIQLEARELVPVVSLQQGRRAAP
ncbi:MAG: DUF6174 domain-containing protein [Longimicrobiales bacterium]|nr:DUF6174 domain-containing protein [Longimicrobiales bacterium]